MATVPYDPRRTVLPRAAGPSPEVRLPYQTGVGATPAAFGAEVAEARFRGAGEVARAAGAEAGALGQLGREVEGFGDVMARHALVIQTQFNQSAAKDAFLSADVKLGELDTWHRGLEGKAAVDALPEYFKRARAIRDDVKNSLPNAEAQRMFDQDFTRRVGFSIVDAGRFAATQFRHYQNRQDDSIVGLATQDSAANYDNDALFEQNLEKIRTATRSKSERQGLPPETAELAEKTAVGNAWRYRLAQMAVYNPEKAKDLFEANKSKIEDAINPAQLVDIQRHIKAGLDNLGARNAANEIFSKYKDEEGPGAFRSMMEDAEKRAEKAAPDDPQFLDNLRTRLTSLYNNKKKQETDEQDHRMNVIQDTIMATEGGTPPTDLDELRAANPQAGAYYDALPPKKKSQVLTALEKNAKADPPMTEARFKRVQELKGMAVNDKDGFMKLDPMTEDLPKRSRGELMMMQRNIERTVDQTQITRAMASVRSMLNDANITSRDTVAMNEFTGSFLDAIRDFQTENKRRPNDEEYRKIAAKLLRYEDPSAWFLTGPRLFQTPIPDADRARIIGALERTLGRAPEEDEIRRLYIMKLYRERQ